MADLKMFPASPRVLHIRVERNVSIPRLTIFREFLKDHDIPVDPFMFCVASSYTLIALRFDSISEAFDALTLLQNYEHTIDALVRFRIHVDASLFVRLLHPEKCLLERPFLRILFPREAAELLLSLT